MIFSSIFPLAYVLLSYLQAARHRRSAALKNSRGLDD
jgi:hypothetical protein